LEKVKYKVNKTTTTTTTTTICDCKEGRMYEHDTSSCRKSSQINDSEIYCSILSKLEYFYLLLGNLSFSLTWCSTALCFFFSSSCLTQTVSSFLLFFTVFFFDRKCATIFTRLSFGFLVVEMVESKDRAERELEKSTEMCSKRFVWKILRKHFPRSYTNMAKKG
jgi:hypothetical protein